VSFLPAFAALGSMIAKWFQGTPFLPKRWSGMANEYQKQADRTDNIADQTTDESLKATHREAAKEYRSKPAAYALFRDGTQVTRTYSSKEEVFRAALLEGLIPAMQAADQFQTLPANYRIEKVEQRHNPQA
jgi:hypothetical protein